LTVDSKQLTAKRLTVDRLLREGLTALDKRRKRIGVMNSLILISPYKGEALNQFFLVK
jgi:hypothetical protein